MKNKMKHIQLFGYSIILLFAFSSCSGMLDPFYDGTLSEDEIFANASNFCGPLNDAYNSLSANFNIDMDNMTDNSVARDLSSNYYLCSTGALRPDNNPVGNWVGSYRQIRHINLFLSKMKLNPDPNAPLPTPVLFYRINTENDRLANVQEFWRLYGEAYFLRAYYYSELLINFGGVTADGQTLGVPLVGDRVLEVTDDLNIPRATYADCVQAIIADCDTAIKYLPTQYLSPQTFGDDRVYGQAKNGRASGISARALKARVLLFAASPAFNITNDVKKWETAAIAAAEAIKSVVGGFQDLVNSPATSATDDIGNAYYFNQLQNKAWNDNGRDLFFRANVQGNNSAYETSYYPPSMYGSALTNPSQNFVDAFPDKNGYPITAAGTVYDPAKPYENRDPRLALWVAYNGSPMGPGNYHTIETFEGGMDAYSPLKGTSRTGYYLRKLVRPKTVSLIPSNLVGTARTHIILGKPELYLTFAEAANEAWGVLNDPMGYGFTARDVLERILRKYSCGAQYMNNVIGDDQNLFRDYIHNCRRLDLSFEGFYFYDLRRWIPNGNPDALSMDVYGMKIVKTGTNTYTYERVLLERKSFKSAYLPIPYSEVYNAPAIVQNKGW